MSNYGESATIKTPEVGDVQKSKRFQTLLHLIEAKEGYIRFIGKKDEQWGKRTLTEYFENSFSMNDRRLIHFTEYYEFIGKSKAKISDLFEVQNNANNDI